MIHTIIAVVVMIVLLMLYGTLMLFTDYIKVSAYLKGILINFIWFLVAEGYGGYDIYYPDIFEQKWLNFALMTIAIMLIVFEISKYVKLRNAFVISVGTAEHMLIAVTIMNFCGGFPGLVAALYFTISALIVLGIHIAAIYGGKHTVSDSFMSRLLAGILFMPAPFIITSGCLMFLDSNKDKSIEVMPLGEFVHKVFEFVQDPEFYVTDKFVFAGLRYTREMFLASLIVAIVAFIIFIIVDSTVDYRNVIKERHRAKSEEEKERMRAEISSRIHQQLDKIDACMSYISTNYKTLKVADSDMKLLRNLYDEATRIKYSYNGAASGAILKRATEIKTEMYIIRDRINDGKSGQDPVTGEQEEKRTGNPEGFMDNEKEKKENAASGFFNGCLTEDEIKKRYRDLCKVFHPDSDNGDQETFLKIKEDYEALVGKAATETI